MCQVTVVVHHLRGSVGAHPTAFRAGCGDVRSSFGVQNGSFLPLYCHPVSTFQAISGGCRAEITCAWQFVLLNILNTTLMYTGWREKSQRWTNRWKIPRQPPGCTFAGIQRPTCHSAVLDTLHDILCAAFKWIQADAFHFFSLWVGLKLEFLLWSAETSVN